MENTFKFSEYFKHNIISFKITGIWFNLMDLKQTPIHIIFYNFTVNILFILAPQICHVIYMYKARNDVKDFADEFYVSLTSLIVVFKSYSLIRHFDIIKKLIYSMDEEIYQPKNIRQTVQAEKVMGAWKKIYWMFSYLTLVFYFMELISPLVNSIRNHTRLLPLVDCYPFEVFTSPTYEFMYIFQSFVLFWLIDQTYNLDTLITGLLSFCSAQCDILCDNLENLKWESLNRSEDEDKVDNLNETLNGCIEHHKRISRFIGDVGYCFSLVIFEQFACSLVTFCTSLFKFSLVEPMTQEFFIIIIYQTVCFLELFVFCWTATELTAKSERIPQAAYKCDWVGASKAFKSSLLNFMQYCQQSFKFKALIFPVSLEMFIQIIKTSVSYYTVLATLDEK